MRASDKTIGPDLTNREQQIVGELAWGRTNSEIATRLQLSDFTIKSHLTRIACRLGANGRAGIVGLAFKDGWIAWDDGRIVLPRWNHAEDRGAPVRPVRPGAGEPEALGALRRAFAVADSQNSAQGSRPRLRARPRRATS